MQKPGQQAGRTITNARVLGKALQQTADGQGSVPVSAVDRVQAGQGDVLVRSRRQAMGEIERIFLEEETAVQAGAEPVPEARLQERILKVLMPYREAASRYYESQNMPSVPGARSSMLRSRPGKSMTLNKPEALIQPAKEPVVQWEEAPMVYEEDKEQRIRKADNQIKQLTQQTHEVLREIQVVKETTVTHEKIIEEQQKLQENREKISRTQVLPKEQIREVLDQEVYRSMEKQLDGSVNRIVDRVYQRLEDKLRSERSRRGLI